MCESRYWGLLASTLQLHHNKKISKEGAINIVVQGGKRGGPQ